MDEKKYLIKSSMGFVLLKYFLAACIVLLDFLCAADGWFVAGCLAMCLVRFLFFALRLIVSLRVGWAGGARPSPEAAPFRSPLLGFS